MFLIDAIKHNEEKKFKTCFIIFTRLSRGGESQAYKIKPKAFKLNLITIEFIVCFNFSL